MVLLRNVKTELENQDKQKVILVRLARSELPASCRWKSPELPSATNSSSEPYRSSNHQNVSSRVVS